MARRVQDFRFGIGDETEEVIILWEAPICDGATMENLACERMGDHYPVCPDIDGVRIVDQDGDELFRWTRRDEAARLGEGLDA
jgi:hypothetical protein